MTTDPIPTPETSHDPVWFKTQCEYSDSRLHDCWHIVENNYDIGMHHTAEWAARATMERRSEIES